MAVSPHSQDPVIKFEDVSVRYRVPQEKVSGIKEYTIRLLQRRLEYKEFWAITDISFHVGGGEVFGIIGRNGAGKSTMLKVMARVLQPTRGRVVMCGHVAPLLELGGGFHPELTGRENVYMNMALLGTPRKLTDKLFDSIVEFAELAGFIDSPIRTYSTGMVARLGFAVATSVRPDILLVDEVLSVGDTQFQEKCFQRMFSFQERGTSIVIVSHSMNTIEGFCDRALWIDGGKIKSIGPVVEVIDHYMHLDQLTPQEKPSGEEVHYVPQQVLAQARTSPGDYTSLTEIGEIYPAADIFDIQQGTLTVWVKNREHQQGRLCALFHTDDSRYVLFSDMQYNAIQNLHERRIVARAGGNRRAINKSKRTFSFPEVSAAMGTENSSLEGGNQDDDWHLIVLSWKGYPEGDLALYVDGKSIGKKPYNRLNDNGSPLPTQIAVGMRPSTWTGEIHHDQKGELVESRPITTLSIQDGGIEIKDLRLYKRVLTPEEIASIQENQKPTRDRQRG